VTAQVLGFENRRKNGKLINDNGDTFSIFYGVTLANNTAADMVKMLLFSKQHSNNSGGTKRDIFLKKKILR
jgi:hypothetical protein